MEENLSRRLQSLDGLRSRYVPALRTIVTRVESWTSAVEELPSAVPKLELLYLFLSILSGLEFDKCCVTRSAIINSLRAGI